MQSADSIHGWWLLRACGRNPLVRASDRLELLIIGLAIWVVLVAAACAGALGTAVHEARSSVYIAQAQTRHTVVATAIDDSTVVLGVNTATRVSARWQVNGTERTGSFPWDQVVKAGDPLTIWVDREGDRVDAPTPISRAGVDAVAIAYAAWMTVTLAAAGLTFWARSRLDRWRDSAWERAIRCLVQNDAGAK